MLMLGSFRQVAKTKVLHSKWLPTLTALKPLMTPPHLTNPTLSQTVKKTNNKNYYFSHNYHTKNKLQQDIYDRTQGPAASISAGPAAISRVFTAFYSEKHAKKPEAWRQTGRDQVNMLRHVKKYFSVRNGYVVSTKKEAPLPGDPSDLRALCDKVEVCVHVGVDVLFRGSPDGMAVVMDRPNTINQVFCAAMNLSQGTTGYANSRLKDSAEKAKFLLQAAYRGTYLAALSSGSRKLFLTLIGGGAFGNSQYEILRTIVEVHEELALSKEVNGSLEEVHVSLFSVPSCLSKVVAEVKAKKIPFKYLSHGKTTTVVDQYFPK